MYFVLPSCQARVLQHSMRVQPAIVRDRLASSVRRCEGLLAVPQSIGRLPLLRSFVVLGCEP